MTVFNRHHDKMYFNSKSLLKWYIYQGFVSDYISNWLSIPRPKGELDLSEFQRSCNDGQHKGELLKNQKNSKSHFLLLIEWFYNLPERGRNAH